MILLPHTFADDVGGFGPQARTWLDDNFAAVGVVLSPNPFQFGGKGTGIGDETASIQAALDTGAQEVLLPRGQWNISSRLLQRVPNQRLIGLGWDCQINGLMTVADYMVVTSNSSGWQGIENITLNGVSNVLANIAITSPDVRIRRNQIVNQTSFGGGIVLVDEDIPTNKFCFDTHIEDNLIYGVRTAGNYGIQCGVNHQGTYIANNSLQNWGSHVYLNGASTTTTIYHNIMQRSDVTGPGAIVMDRGTSTPFWNVLIDNNYFEQNQNIVFIDRCNVQNLTIRNNYAYRNTVSGVGSRFYKTGVGTDPTSLGRIQIDDNDSDGFEYFSELNIAGSSQITSAVNNTVVNGTGYSTGAFADNIYKKRAYNAYYGGYQLTAGVFTSQSVTRMEVGNTTFNVLAKFETHEYIDQLKFQHLQVGATPTVRVRLHQVTFNTDTVIIDTGIVSTGGLIVMPINIFTVDGSYYYFEFICALNGGTTAYIYPEFELKRQ